MVPTAALASGRGAEKAPPLLLLSVANVGRTGPAASREGLSATVGSGSGIEEEEEETIGGEVPLAPLEAAVAGGTEPANRWVLPCLGPCRFRSFMAAEGA